MDNEKEDSLWDQYEKTGAIEDKNAIIEYHLPYVRYLAERAVMKLTKNVTAYDLFSFGVFGLNQAIERFDRTKNIRFRSYSTLRIKGEMMDSIRRELDGVPRDTRWKIRKIKEDIAKVEKILGHKPSDVEVAEVLGLTYEEIQRRAKILNTNRVMSIHDISRRAETEGWEDDVKEFAPVQFSYTENPSTSLENEEFRSFVKAGFDDDPRLWIIVDLYFWKHKRLRDIGLELDISESRTSQLLSRAKSRLRSFLFGYVEFLTS